MRGDKEDSLFKEIMTEYFPNLGREMEIHVRDFQTSPNELNSRKSIVRHIIIKSPNIKDREF